MKPRSRPYPRPSACRCGKSLTAHCRAAAVSLVEVLIVISIIAFLLSMLIPSVGAAREQVRNAVCRGNLRQFGVAVQLYRNDWNDYLPEEGSMLPNVFAKTNNWFNALPPYLGLPAYAELEGANVSIKDHPDMHVWICPTKNRTGAFKSGSGKNQFHYGMNQVLDGMGTPQNPSKDMPDFPDQDSIHCKGTVCKDYPLLATPFDKKPYTVFMFDIHPNSPAGSPRNVGLFHRGKANFLYLAGGVDGFDLDAIVMGNDAARGTIRWDFPKLYWGYPQP